MNGDVSPDKQLFFRYKMMSAKIFWFLFWICGLFYTAQNINCNLLRYLRYCEKLKMLYTVGPRHRELETLWSCHYGDSVFLLVLVCSTSV